MSKRYRPDPNPPAEPKECQECGTIVDGEETNGWWLERENHQRTNYFVLFCMKCCVQKMNVWRNYPDVGNQWEAKEVLR